MSTTQTKLLKIFAPAKINLYLHVTGRLENGYHTLDSLITFADIGDTITIEPATDFHFNVKGTNAGKFTSKEMDSSPDSANLAVQAAWALSRAAQKVLNVRITLAKELPMAAGLGGGSADAAAVLWGLCEWWNILRNTHYLPGIMARLGADVPVCFSCKPARVRGIGDILDPVPPMAEIPVVLVNPGQACSTAAVFGHFPGPFREPQALPETLDQMKNLAAFLEKQNNDLQAPAQALAPAIKDVLAALQAQKGCKLSRMSGSGATCFGLFEDERGAKKAAEEISEKNPEWWVKACWLNRSERY